MQKSTLMARKVAEKKSNDIMSTFRIHNSSLSKFMALASRSYERMLQENPSIFNILDKLLKEKEISTIQLKILSSGLAKLKK